MAAAFERERDPEGARMSDETITGKRCAKCGEWKGFDAFYTDRRARDGKQSHCGACKAKASAEYKKKNPEVAKRHANAWNAANPEKRRAIARKFAQKCNKARKASERHFLADSYVRRVMKVRANEASQELINLKREQLSLHRLLRDLKQAIEKEPT